MASPPAPQPWQLPVRMLSSRHKGMCAFDNRTEDLLNFAMIGDFLDHPPATLESLASGRRIGSDGRRSKKKSSGRSPPINVSRYIGPV